MMVPQTPLVAVIMGSQSDWEVMKYSAHTLTVLGIPYQCEIVSAHRTPYKMFEYASGAVERGVECIIAGAGGAAHLPGMCAAVSLLPVLGVPVAHDSSMLRGQDALLSIVQMPAGIPVGTLAIGKPGAVNAALLAAAMLGNKYEAIREKYEEYREKQTQLVLDSPYPESGSKSSVPG